MALMFKREACSPHTQSKELETGDSWALPEAEEHTSFEARVRRPESAKLREVAGASMCQRYL